MDTRRSIDVRTSLTRAEIVMCIHGNLIQLSQTTGDVDN